VSPGLRTRDSSVAVTGDSYRRPAHGQGVGVVSSRDTATTARRLLGAESDSTQSPLTGGTMEISQWVQELGPTTVTVIPGMNGPEAMKATVVGVTICQTPGTAGASTGMAPAGDTGTGKGNRHPGIRRHPRGPRGRHLGPDHQRGLGRRHGNGGSLGRHPGVGVGDPQPGAGACAQNDDGQTHRPDPTSRGHSEPPSTQLMLPG